MDELGSRKFQLVLADPPWAFETFDKKRKTPTAKDWTRHSSAEDHYPTMTLAEMASLPVGQVAAEDSLLAMWVVGSHLEEALLLGDAWGFSYTTDLFWWLKVRLRDADQIDLFTGDVPPPRMSMGYHSRKQGEMCLLFKRGRGLPVCDHGVRQVICEAPREHSRKPDCQYERLEALYGDVSRIELFARNRRVGWESWGNQVDKFGAEAAA